ncbi:MAG: DNA polymerase I [Candidatus Sericytochromatia bacterium]|nr:DNA polymerase I [Candidatus Sericytochromatia bacterium]
MSEVKDITIIDEIENDEISNEQDKIIPLKAKNNYLILIDGHALAYRAYHAMYRANMRNKDGLPTGAIYRFTKTILETITNYKPGYMIVTFDTGDKTFRKELYQEYKATRKPSEPDFKEQMPYIFDVVKALEIPIFRLPGFEADDLLGTLANQAVEQGLEVGIVTGDRDLLQLATDKINIYLPDKDSGLKRFGIDETIEKLGIRPEQFADFRGITGDSSDNIPGVKGIGDVGAEKLIKEYGTLENIYENIDKITPKGIKEKLIENKDMAFLSKKLSIIDINAPVELDLEHCLLNRPDEAHLKELFTKLEFKSLSANLNKILVDFHSSKHIDDDEDLWFDFNEEDHSEIPLDLNVNIVKSLDDVRALVEELSSLSYFSIDLETTSIDSLNAEIVGISISHDKDVLEKKAVNFNIFYIPVGHILEEDPIKSLDRNEVLNIFKPLLENKNILKIGHNLKYEINVFSNYDIKLVGIQDDTIIADYLLNSSTSHALKEISKSHLHYFMTPITELIGTGKNVTTMDKVLVEDSAKYAGADSAVTLELSFFLREKLKEVDMISLYEDMELPLVAVLAEIEQNGIKIDAQKLYTLSDKIKLLMADLEIKIYKEAGREFNVNSPKQLSVILFEEMNIPTKGIKKNKSTGYSTDAGVLESLASNHQIVSHIMEFRQLTKIKSTYADSLTQLINKKTGRVHTSFNQSNTTTGRLSSSDPNLQNIPIKTELGREIRRAFITSNPDDVIITADYSQIELRLLAHYTQDPTFIEAFKNDIDIHSRTVMDVFKLENISQVTPELRRIGKTINFGIVYGQSAFGLADKLKMPIKEASEIIKKFNETYKSITEYVEKMVNFADQHGYVITLFNRRRYLPEIHSPNKTLREAGKRNAINTPLQGTAADIIKVAMIKVSQALKDNNLKTKMLLQVHDELVFEAPQDEVEKVKKLITEIMENVCPEISVPLKVSVNTGKSWVEAK